MSLKQVVSGSPVAPPQKPELPRADPPLQAVVEALAKIRYGVVQLTVHDGRLVQVDVTERRRFP